MLSFAFSGSGVPSPASPIPATDNNKKSMEDNNTNNNNNNNTNDDDDDDGYGGFDESFSLDESLPESPIKPVKPVQSPPQVTTHTHKYESPKV